MILSDKLNQCYDGRDTVCIMTIAKAKELEEREARLIKALEFAVLTMQMNDLHLERTFTTIYAAINNEPDPYDFDEVENV